MFYHKIEVILKVLVFLSEDFLFYSHFQDVNNELWLTIPIKIMNFAGIVTYGDLYKEYIMILADIFYILLSRTKKKTSILLREGYTKIIGNLVKGSLFYIDHSSEENLKMFMLLNFCMKYTDKDLGEEAKAAAKSRHAQLEILYLPKKK